MRKKETHREVENNRIKKLEEENEEKRKDRKICEYLKAETEVKKS